MLQIRLGSASSFVRQTSARTDVAPTYSPAPNPAVFDVRTARSSAPTDARQDQAGYDTNVQPASGTVATGYDTSVTATGGSATLVDTGSGSILVHDTITSRSGTATRDPATGVIISPEPMPDAVKTASSDAYRCDAFSCRGTGLYDLQFHQLQDLMNQVATKIGVATITVNGVIDVSNTMPLYASIANSGLVPGITMPVDVPFNPQWIADNIASINWALGAFLQTSAWKRGLINTSKPSYSTRPDMTPPATQTTYVCADGMHVTDPGMCVDMMPPAGGGGSGGDPGIMPPSGGGGGGGGGGASADVCYDQTGAMIPCLVIQPQQPLTTGQKIAKVAKSPIAIGVMSILGGILLGSVVLRNS